jgi:hypothetical protein
VYIDGAYYPMCFPDNAINDDVVDGICLAMGHSHGGRIVKTGKALEKDAISVNSTPASQHSGVR